MAGGRVFRSPSSLFAGTIIRMLYFFLPLFLLPFFAGADEAVPPVPVKFSVSYLDDRGLLALNYENHPGWHTYWKNPGDAGLPIKAEFRIDGREVAFEPLEWPAPKKFLEKGDIVAYGYDGAYSLFFTASPEVLGAGKSLSVRSHWLVCSHICIPGEKSVELSLPGGLVVGDDPGREGLLRRLAALPKPRPLPDYLDIALGLDGDKKGFVFLYRFSGSAPTGLDVLTPFVHDRFDFGHEKLMADASGNLYALRPAGWDGDYEEPPVPLPVNGTFDPPERVRFLFNDSVSRSVSVVEKEFTMFDTGQSVRVEGLLSPVESQATADPLSGLLFYLLLAFFGGLILNAMPCVLPVISLKLFGLIKHAGSSRLDVLKHNAFYTLGVLAAFAALALAVVVLKSVGMGVGWGFQLQSPGFVLAMVLVVFVFALNLFGLFDFGVPGGSTLGGLDFGKGFLGDFMGGVLSSVLSTPCSAPFLGTALAFAFASSPPVIFAVFTAVGLGLAFPFVLVGLFPSALRLLPKPGAWMDKMKKFLALALVLTALWLAHVFSSLAGGASGLELHVAAALLFFAFYFRAHISHSFTAGALVFLPPALLVAHLFASSVLVGTRDSEGPSWEPWSVEKMEAYRSGGRRVFVDFTADWCLTCKVNEKLVLETQGFHDFVQEGGIDLLVADWTRRDPLIGDWLKGQGFVGVPAYFAIRDGRIIALGETITLGEIRKAFE